LQFKHPYKGYGSDCNVKPLDNIVEAHITWETRGSNPSKRNAIMSYVFVVDTNRKPLNPVHPGKARYLLKAGKAAVLKRYPFTIILTYPVDHCQVEPLRVKIDPGSRTTGIAVCNDATGKVVFAAELTHRGQAIRDALLSRRGVRRGRRTRHTRYRKPHYQNRTRQPRWLAPSLMSRVSNVLTWVKRLLHVCPIAAISQELVRFDLQQMENPEIAGVAYQQGTLFGYEIREYLLEKWQRRCAYCAKENVPLQVEHIVPRAKGGSDRVSNLALACEKCNTAKGIQEIAVFLGKKPEVLKRILTQAKAPLKDAAAVNATRWKLFESLRALSLPVECGSGGLTKVRRVTRNLEKTHWVDAACVGKSTPTVLDTRVIVPLRIKAVGQGRRQMCVTDKYGFPKQHKARQNSFCGYRTGDLVKAITPKGTVSGRIAIRHRPSFRLGTVDIHPKYMRRLHRADGYMYQSAD
jgi:5-methylcytosine-specific restriction endonuclease McrA